MYMAPEICAGEKAGPASDLYSVGIMLFELLAGQAPFSGMRDEIIAQQMSSARPDPRKVAPDAGISDELAEVCLRALEIDPARRHANATEMADALVAAVRIHPSSRPPAPGASSGGRLPLSGRAKDLEWAEATLESARGGEAHVLSGRSGSGRTRLLEEVGTIARRRGAFTVTVAAPPAPLDRVSYGFARLLARAITGLSPNDVLLASAETHASALVVAGLGVLLDAHLQRGAFTPIEATAAALGWSVRLRLERARRDRVVLLLDDLDRIDTASRSALARAGATGELDGVTLIATSQAPLSWLVGSVVRPVPGIRRRDAEDLLAGVAELPPLTVSEFRPLYLEQLRRWMEEEGWPTRHDLVGIVRARVEHLRTAERRVLHAIAVSGIATATELESLVGASPGLPGALRSLTMAGLVQERETGFHVCHALFSQVACENAPAGALRLLHDLALELLGPDGDLELRAHHAIHGEPSLAGFLLLEQAAVQRADHGDPDGAAALLEEGMVAARTVAVQGEAELASTAWLVFGEKLAGNHVRAGRFEAAAGVLRDVLERIPPREPAHARLARMLAEIPHR
jgi:hypothetical protein